MRRRRIAALIAVPLLLVSAAACGNDDSSEGGSAPKVSGQADAKPKVDKGQGAPPKKLQVKVLKEGDGPAVKKGEALNANYLGQTWDGKAFDNSWDRGAPATFEIGSGKVIKGWDEGLVGQKLGSRVELVIPPDKGYGAQAQQSIPANSTLVFVVDLKKIMPSKIDGKPVAQDNGDLPKVGTNIDGKAPKITLPKGQDAPKDVERDDHQGQGRDGRCEEHRAGPLHGGDLEGRQGRRQHLGAGAARGAGCAGRAAAGLEGRSQGQEGRQPGAGRGAEEQADA